MANENFRATIVGHRNLMESLDDVYSAERFFNEGRKIVNYKTGKFEKPLLLFLAHERDAATMKQASNVVKAAAGYVEGDDDWNRRRTEVRAQTMVDRDQNGSSCRAQAILLGHVPEAATRQFEFESTPKVLHVNTHCLLCGLRDHDTPGCEWFQNDYPQKFGRIYLASCTSAETKYVVQGYAYQVPAALEAFLVPQDNATAFSAAIAAAAGSKHQDNFQQDD